MGWIDDQIAQRARGASENIEDALSDLSQAVSGHTKKRGRTIYVNEKRSALKAIDEILAYYGADPVEVPVDVTDINEAFEYLLRPSGIMRRSVRLNGEWYRDAVGPMLGRKSDGTPVALMPRGISDYDYFDPDLGVRVKLDRNTAKDIRENAVCFYKPLPLKALNMVDLARYIARSLSNWDYIIVALSSLAVTLLGLIAPYVNRLIFGTVLPSGRFELLAPVAVMLAGVSISSTMVSVTKSLILTRLNTKTGMAVQSATMMRVLSLPASFFKRYSVGELTNRIQSVNSLCGMLSDVILSVWLSSLFSLCYLFQIYNLAPELAAPAIAILFVTLAASFATAVIQLRLSKKAMELNAKKDGLTYMLVAGVSKLRVAGAEKNAFSKWAKQYAACAKLTFNPPASVRLGGIVMTAISLFSTVVLYYFAVRSNVGVAGYMAFNVSYSMVSGAFVSLSGTALTFARIRTVMDAVQPLIKTMPEVTADKKIVTRLSGSIELNNVSFRYDSNSPDVISGLSLTIKPKQYVAIVGMSGCGKTTLMRLLLGLETPQKGAIYYDGADLNTLNLNSLRRHIGVVMQNGRLFQGDILSNITISAPWMTEKDAWEAAEIAGIADDIRAMPMGMYTLISDGSNGISGGQRQRILIARAVAAKPRILFFDEATSALDNRTQALVTKALDGMARTRVVIAHRLSTIRHCDRIIVLDKGVVAEDGTYDQLAARGGLFSELIARQRVGFASADAETP